MSAITPYYPTADLLNGPKAWELNTHCSQCINSKDLKKYPLRKAIIIFVDEVKINTPGEIEDLSELMKAMQKIAFVFIVLMPHLDSKSENFDMKLKKFESHPDLKGVIIGQTSLGCRLPKINETSKVSLMDLFGEINSWLADHQILINEANIISITDRMIVENPFDYCVINRASEKNCALEKIMKVYNKVREFSLPRLDCIDNDAFVTAFPKRLTCCSMTIHSNEKLVSSLLKCIAYNIATNYADLMTEDGYYHRTRWLDFSENPPEFPSNRDSLQFIELLTKCIEDEVLKKSDVFQKNIILISSNEEGFLPDILKQCNIDQRLIPKHKITIRFRCMQHALGYSIEKIE